jgi:hypothetical protein
MFNFLKHFSSRSGAGQYLRNQKSAGEHYILQIYSLLIHSAEFRVFTMDFEEKGRF